MRTIKFRAWDKTIRQMVEITPFQLAICLDKDSSHNYEVMQFTGLFDKNGKEIYGGGYCPTF